MKKLKKLIRKWKARGEENKMSKLKKFLDKSLEIICIALFVFITMIGSYQIITRYVFNSPSTVSEELLTFSFTWLALLAAALIFGKREHMRMSFFADRFKGNTAVIMSIISEILVMLFAGLVLVYGGSAITKLTSTQITASLGVHMSYIYIVLPISGVITILYNIINLAVMFKQLKSE